MQNGPTIQLGDHRVGDGHPAFIIAEAGANHNGELSMAKELVVAAREAGADCIKFQTFTAENFCADRTKTFTYKSQGREVTESEFEMFKRLELRRDEWVELIAFCNEQKIFFFTTVQDPVNLEMMLELDLPAIKVGSDDFDHLTNLRLYANTGLPLIISKGMSGADETDKVLNEIAPLASGGLGVLHCVSLYPSEAHHLNLKQIVTLRETYPHLVWGFSDHTPSTVAPALAVTLGARIIEKHFTLDHDLPGPDHWFSMDPTEFGEMVRNIRFAEAAMGSGRIEALKEESISREIMRRRVVAARSLDAGAVLGDDDVTFKRAEAGAFAGDWEEMRGCRLSEAKKAGEAITKDDVVS